MSCCSVLYLVSRKCCYKNLYSVISDSIFKLSLGYFSDASVSRPEFKLSNQSQKINIYALIIVFVLSACAISAMTSPHGVFTVNCF